MPLGQCVWCARYRLVSLHTWSSARTRQQLCGEVCGHCFYGGEWDDCRTCRARRARGEDLGTQRGVRPLGARDALQLLQDLTKKARRGAR